MLQTIFPQGPTLVNGRQRERLSPNTVGRARDEQISEVKPERELNNSRFVRLSAQVLQTLGYIEASRTRTIVERVIKHIEEVSGESDIHAFPDGEVFEQ